MGGATRRVLQRSSKNSTEAVGLLQVSKLLATQQGEEAQEDAAISNSPCSSSLFTTSDGAAPKVAGCSAGKEARPHIQPGVGSLGVGGQREVVQGVQGVQGAREGCQAGVRGSNSWLEGWYQGGLGATRLRRPDVQEDCRSTGDSYPKIAGSVSKVSLGSQDQACSWT